jgi:hypothetical protein
MEVVKLGVWFVLHRFECGATFSEDDHPPSLWEDDSVGRCTEELYRPLLLCRALIEHSTLCRSRRPRTPVGTPYERCSPPRSTLESRHSQRTKGGE